MISRWALAHGSPPLAPLGGEGGQTFPAVVDRRRPFRDNPGEQLFGGAWLASLEGIIQPCIRRPLGSGRR